MRLWVIIGLNLSNQNNLNQIKKRQKKKKGIKIKVKSLVRMIKSGSGTAAESLLIFVGKGLHKVPENIPPWINHIKDILNIINNLNNNIFLKMLFCIALT